MSMVVEAMSTSFLQAMAFEHSSGGWLLTGSSSGGDVGLHFPSSRLFPRLHYL